MTVKDWGLIFVVVFTAWACFVLKWSVPFLPDPPAYAEGKGLEFATDLVKSANRLATFLLFSGWILVLASGILAFAASLVGPVPPPTGPGTIFTAVTTQRGLMCAAVAVILGGIGWQLLDRSTAAIQIASAATHAIGMTHNPGGDEKAYKMCVKAKGAWLDGRMNFDRLESIVSGLNQVNGEANGAQPGSEVQQGNAAGQPVVAPIEKKPAPADLLLPPMDEPDSDLLPGPPKAEPEPEHTPKLSRK